MPTRPEPSAPPHRPSTPSARAWKSPSPHGQRRIDARRRRPALSPARSRARRLCDRLFDAALGRADAVGVKVTDIIEDQTPFRRRYEPSHPDADKEGFVAMPNVDVPEEMVDMIGAAPSLSGQPHGDRAHSRHDQPRAGTGK